MIRHNEAYDINLDEKNIWNTIATYMNDEIREEVHLELAPCRNHEFLARYLELDPSFKTFLKEEFDIDETEL